MEAILETAPCQFPKSRQGSAARHQSPPQTQGPSTAIPDKVGGAMKSRKG
jgi:hypothetical protein